MIFEVTPETEEVPLVPMVGNQAHVIMKEVKEVVILVICPYSSTKVPQGQTTCNHCDRKL